MSPDGMANTAPTAQVVVSCNLDCSGAVRTASFVGKKGEWAMCDTCHKTGRLDGDGNIRQLNPLFNEAKTPASRGETTHAPTTA